jgi:hypothetical protein
MHTVLFIQLNGFANRHYCVDDKNLDHIFDQLNRDVDFVVFRAYGSRTNAGDDSICPQRIENPFNVAILRETIYIVREVVSQKGIA